MRTGHAFKRINNVRGRLIRVVFFNAVHDQHGNVLDILARSWHSGQTVVPVAEGLAIGSAGDRDGQAQELRRRRARDPTERSSIVKAEISTIGVSVAPADRAVAYHVFAADAPVRLEAIVLEPSLT